MIRSVQKKDAQAIANIYNYYIVNTVVTFEEEPVTADEMWSRISAIQKKHPYLIFEHNKEILGYAYGFPWKGRAAYKYCCEISVYLRHDRGGKGVGTRLYTALIDKLRIMKMHSVIGGVALPNEASVHLHEKLGFNKVAHFSEQGFKFEKWIDVAYWELILNETNP